MFILVHLFSYQMKSESLFQLFDVDGNGHVEKDELAKALMNAMRDQVCLHEL